MTTTQIKKALKEVNKDILKNTKEIEKLLKNNITYLHYIIEECDIYSLQHYIKLTETCYQYALMIENINKLSDSIIVKDE